MRAPSRGPITTANKPKAYSSKCFFRRKKHDLENKEHKGSGAAYCNQFQNVYMLLINEKEEIAPLFLPTFIKNIRKEKDERKQ